MGLYAEKMNRPKNKVGKRKKTESDGSLPQKDKIIKDENFIYLNETFGASGFRIR